jgi:Flp pilus assembly protein protease CpaA
MPDERVLSQLCALSGDDVAVLAAQIQAERSRTDEGKSMWLMIAKRLSGAAAPSILSVLFAIGLVAGYTGDVKAATVQASKTLLNNSLYIVLSTKLSVAHFVLVRLRCGPRRLMTLLKLGIVLCA